MRGKREGKRLEDEGRRETGEGRKEKGECRHDALKQALAELACSCGCLVESEPSFPARVTTRRDALTSLAGTDRVVSMTATSKALFQRQHLNMAYDELEHLCRCLTETALGTVQPSLQQSTPDKTE